MGFFFVTLLKQTNSVLKTVNMASRGARGGGRGKKKRSFLTKARKYAKKGVYGRGKDIDEETYNYFVRVMERLKEEFEDEEDKGI